MADDAAIPSNELLRRQRRVTLARLSRAHGLATDGSLQELRARLESHRDLLARGTEHGGPVNSIVTRG